MAALPDVVDLERLIAGEAGWYIQLRGHVEAAEAQLSAHAAQSAAKQEELLARMDADGDGVVDQSEFTAWAGEQAGRMADLEARLEASVAHAHASSQESAQMCNDASTKVTSLQTQVESGLRVSRAGVSAAKAAQDAALGSFGARLGSQEDTVTQMHTALDRKISAHVAEATEMRASVLELCASTTASVNLVKEELAKTTVAKGAALAKVTQVESAQAESKLLVEAKVSFTGPICPYACGCRLYFDRDCLWEQMAELEQGQSAAATKLQELTDANSATSVTVANALQSIEELKGEVRSFVTFISPLLVTFESL